METTYTANPSTAAPTATFYSLKGLNPDAGSFSISDLSTDNYPADRVPLKDLNGYDMPNPANQIIFKNQAVSWWINCINTGKVVYTPVSNTVNWSYVDGETKYHILFEISSFMIPNRSNSIERDETTKVTTIVMEDNGVFNLTQTYKGF